MKRSIFFDLQYCIFLLTLLISCFVISCTNSPKSRNVHQQVIDKKVELRTKPPTTSQDSLKIKPGTAVFYQADSIQLKKIKELTDVRIYDGSMHEYFYQTRNAHIVLKKNWGKIKIVEVRNKRYLDFIKEDRNHEVIDLNKYNDAFGLFIFDGKKSPVLVDMTNLEEALYFYFGK